MKIRRVTNYCFMAISLLLASAPLVNASNVMVREGDSVDQAVAIMGTLRVNGTVRENAVSVWGDVKIGPHGAVHGDVVSIGGRIIRFPGSRVDGKEIALGIPVNDHGRLFMQVGAFATTLFAVMAGAFLVAYTIGALALIILVLTFFDKQLAGAQKKLVERPARSFFLGLIGLVCAIPALLLLAITIIGIPLAFVGSIILVSAILLGTVAVGQWVGTEVAKRFRWNLQPVWTGLLGMTLLFLVCMIPIVGWVIHIGVHTFGLGGVIQSRFKPLKEVQP